MIHKEEIITKLILIKVMKILIKNISEKHLLQKIRKIKGQKFLMLGLYMI